MANLVKTVELKVLADDAEAQAKLDAITAKADRLRELNPEITPKVDAFEASAKLAVLRQEVKDATKTDEIKVKVNDRSLAEAEAKLSVLNRIGGGFAGGGGGSGLFSSLDELPFGGLPALVAALPVVGALLVELTGLVSGFAAAGAGLGAFALLALPTFDKIKNAYTGISAAQTAYNNAVALQKADPTKTHASDVAAALVKLKIAEDSVSPSTRRAISGIDQLKSTYEKMSKAFQPIVMKVFNDGLQVANDLLPTLKAPATDAGNAIDGLLKQFGKFTQSKGFADWLAKFDKLIGPSITAIGEGIGHVVNSFGKLLTVLPVKDVVNSINIAFRILSGTFGGLTYVVQHVASLWSQMVRGIERNMPAFEHAFDNAKHAFDNFSHAMDNVTHADVNVRHSFDNVRHALENVQHAFDNVRHFIDIFSSDTRSVFEAINGTISRWASNVRTDTEKVRTWFQQLPGRIMSALGNLGSMLFGFGEHIISMLASGISSAAGGVLSGAMHFVASVISSFIPHSPAKQGPLSGSGSPDIAGRKIALMLGQGIRSGSSAVSASSSALAAAAGIGGTGGGGSAGRAVQLRVSVAGGADASLAAALMKLLRFEIVQTGGGGPNSVQRALGQAV